MLDDTPENLYREIQDALRFQKLFLSKRDDMLTQYGGEAYRSDQTGDYSENSYYEWIRLTTGKVIFDDPVTRIRTRRAGTQKLVAQAMQRGLNRWIKDTKLRRLLKRVYVEQCFGFAVVQTVQEPRKWQDPRDSSIKHWPVSYDLDPERFFIDPVARSFGQARFKGHTWVRDKADLLKEAEKHPNKGWIVEAIKDLAEDSGIETLNRDEKRSSISRKEIVAHEVWVPEINKGDPNKGFHGTIYTVVSSGPANKGAVVGDEGNDDKDKFKAGFIREPRPYYGPRWGPYTLFGMYYMPGSPYPLSTFAATYGQIRELNEIVRATNRAIRRYKKIILTDAASPDIAKKLKDSPDAFVVPIKGLTKDMIFPVELGGITEQHQAQIVQALDRVDRSTGISDPQRGNLEGSVTATAVSVAESASQGAIAYIKQEFTDSTTQVLDTAGWYLYHDDRVEYALGEGDASDVLIDPATGDPMEEPWFMGGLHDEDSGARYDDLELMIEPYSMERTNEALARAQYMEMFQLFMAAAPIIPQTPYYDWKDLFEQAGQVNNNPDAGRFFNAQIAAQVQGQQQAAFEQQQKVEFSKQVGAKSNQATSAMQGRAAGGRAGALQSRIKIGASPVKPGSNGKK